MGLWEFLQFGQQPAVPVRKKEDVRQIVARWEDDWGDEDGEGVDYADLEEDIHALAAVAIEALPD